MQDKANYNSKQSIENGSLYNAHNCDCIEEYESIVDILREDREVVIEKNQMSIFEIHRRYEREELNLRPFYQRKDVWSISKKSRLIESVLRNIPIPAIYLSETEKDTFEVIDGQQRLRAFFDFMENNYKLSKLPVLSELEGMYFNDMPLRYARKIEDYQLFIFMIKKESHPDIKFDIFMRINEGAVQLNAQELRNCIFRGNGIETVRRLAEDMNYKRLIGRKLQISRLKDEELVLRFLSFYFKGYEAYSGNMNSFLNDTLRNFKNYCSNYENIEKIFSETMECIYRVFGENAFTKNINSNSKVNLSLFDVITVSFSKGDRIKIVKNSSALIDALNELIEDERFYNSITFSTLTKNSVETRFIIWNRTVKDLV